MDAFKTIFSAVKLVANENEQIQNVFAMFEELVMNFFKLLDVMVIPSEEEGSLDLYCKGMFMGLHGSQMIVRIANTLLNGMSYTDFKKREQAAYQKAMTKKKVSKKGGSIDLWKTISSKIGEIGKAIADNKNDEL